MADDTPQDTTGTPDPTPEGKGATPKPDDTGQEPDTDLADPGKKALDAERKARRAAERERSELQAELESLRLSQQSEHEQALSKARKEGHDEAMGVWKPRYESFARNNAALRVMQAAGVTASDLVLPHLNLDAVEVDEKGNVDTSAIEAALQDVLARYPMLADTSNGSTAIHHADLGPKAKPARTEDPNVALRRAMLGGRPRR